MEQKTSATKTLHCLADEIKQWADDTFPQRTPQSAMLKMFEEIGELIKSPNEVFEYADIMIMLLDLLLMHGLSVDDLLKAIDAKNNINSKRQWKVTAMGTMAHTTAVDFFSLGAIDKKEGRGYKFSLKDLSLVATLPQLDQYESGYDSEQGDF